eukprot:SAG22_NODE_6713_length_820_cov_182.905687_1_plen_25_part_10
MGGWVVTCVNLMVILTYTDITAMDT